MPRSRIRWNETQSVSDHSLSGRLRWSWRPAANSYQGCCQSCSRNCLCRIVGRDIQPDQTISAMAQAAFEEILVEREKSHSVKLVQQRYQIAILRAKPGHLPSNLPMGQPPTVKHVALVIREVFVQQDHTVAGASVSGEKAGCNCPRSFSHARPANRTASLTAAKGMRPPQRVLQMKSHVRPAATSSRTCQTMMRVPLKVGLPWQIAGSATIYWPSSIRLDCFVTRWPLLLFTSLIYGVTPPASSRNFLNNKSVQSPVFRGPVNQ
jgi:hypothetical protein